MKATSLYREGDPATVGFAELGGGRSFLNVPLVKDGRTVGAISIYRPEVRP